MLGYCCDCNKGATFRVGNTRLTCALYPDGIKPEILSEEIHCPEFEPRTDPYFVSDGDE